MNNVRAIRTVVFFVVVLPVLALTENAWAPLGADDAMGIIEGVQRQETLGNLNRQLKDQELVRPSQEERKAIDKLLSQKPSPEALDKTDAKFLRAIRREPAWTRKQRQIVHMILKEVSGVDFDAEDQTVPKR